MKSYPTPATRLRAVADIIEAKPDLYNQRTRWTATPPIAELAGAGRVTAELALDDHLDEHICRTNGCVAGWAVALSSPKDVLAAIEATDNDWVPVGANLLGLDDQFASWLFDPERHPDEDADDGGMPHLLRHLATIHDTSPTPTEIDWALAWAKGVNLDGTIHQSGPCDGSGLDYETHGSTCPACNQHFRSIVTCETCGQDLDEYIDVIPAHDRPEDRPR